VPAATDAVWLDVLPSMKSFGPMLAKGAEADATKVGKTSGAKFGKAMLAGLAVVGGGALLATKALHNIGATFDEVRDTIRVGTGATGQALDTLVQSAKNVGTTVPAEFGEVSTAIADLNTRLGLTGQPLEDMAGQFLELSRITGTDLTTNIEKVSRVFGDWGIAAEDQSASLDYLFKVSQTTGIGIDSLSDKVVQFGAPMRQFGFSFEESAALMGKWEKEGVNTETIMGGLRAGLGKLAKAGKDPADAFKEITDRIKGAGSEGEATAAAIEIFGQRAGPDLAAAVREGRFDLDELMGTLEGSEETIMDAGDQTKDFGEQWLMFKNRVLEVVEPVAKRVFDFMGRAMEEISGGVSAFAAAWRENDGQITSSGLPGFLEQLAYSGRQIFDWLKANVVPVLKDSASWFMRNRDVIIPVVGALGAMYAAFKTFMFIKSVTLAVKAFNLMLMANPIGLVVLALVGLVAGLVIAYKRSETFREIVDKAFSAVAAAGKWMWENVLKPAFGFLMDYWTAVAKAVMWAWENLIKPAWSALQSVISSLWKNVLKPYFTFIIDLWTAVAKGIGRAWEDWIKPTFKTFGDWIGTLREGFRTGVDAIGRIWDGLKSKLSTPVQWVMDVVWNNGLRKLWHTINNLWGGKDDLPTFRLGGPVANVGTSTRGGFRAAAGGVLPGWSPGRDIHTFVSPTGGRLHLSGGEAVMVPEFTRAVGGKAGVDYLNQLARRQGDAALQTALGMGGQRFAKGGIIDLPGWLDALVGITPGMGGIKSILDSLTGGGAGGGLFGSGLVSLAKTVGSKMLGAAKGLFDGKNAATSTVTGWDRTGWTLMEDGSWLPPPHLRGIGKGVGNWQQMWAAVKSSPVGRFARLTSWLRPGDPGLHGQGRAIDIAGSVPYPMGNSRGEMAAINRWIAANFPNSRELIYTPGINLYGGRPHTFNARTRADHWDHVHWGMKNGGVLGAGVYDRGGLLPPGWAGFNTSGQVERVLNGPQDDYFRRFVEVAERGPSQFVGDLYLDSGEFLGKVRGEAAAVVGSAMSARDRRSLSRPTR
jgi:phage-related minor tail protein